MREEQSGSAWQRSKEGAAADFQTARMAVWARILLAGWLTALNGSCDLATCAMSYLRELTLPRAVDQTFVAADFQRVMSC